MKQTYMSLEEIMDSYQTASDVSWQEVLLGDDNDKSFFVVVQRLIDDLGDKQYFDEPIILCDEEYNEEGDYYPAHVSNGIHRMAAYYWSGRKTAFVQHGFLPEDNQEESDTVLRCIFDTTECTEDEEWDLCELVSFRHSGTNYNHWLEIGMGSTTSPGVWNIYVEAPTYDGLILEELYNDLSNNVLQGLPTVLETVELVIIGDKEDIVVDSFSKNT